MSKNRTTVAAVAVSVAAVLALVAAYAVGSAGRSDASDPSASAARTMVLTGRGTATGVPDEVDFSIGVTVTRAGVSDALADADATMKRVLAAIAGFGVDHRRVQTTGLNIHAVYDYSGGTTRLVGYAANERARATVPSLAKAGRAMAAAARAGGNDVRIHSVSLDISDRDRLIARARAAAVADARAKADAYAAASGAHLGQVMSIKEVSAPAPRPQPIFQRSVDSAKALAAGRVPIRAGKQDLAVRIQVVWALS
jgi:uncharacterized protein YggE